MADATTAAVTRPRATDYLEWLRARRRDQVGLLRQLVQIDSQWSNAAGVGQVTRVVTDRLVGLGFTAASVPQPPVRDDDRWLAELLAPDVPYESLAATVVAHRPGVGTDRVLLLADLDTAFAGGVDGEAPFRIDGDLARGTGVADMKGGLVVLLGALEAIEALGGSPPPLTVVLAGDEQAGSLGSRHAIRREAAACRWALCLECARDGGQLMAARAHIGVALIEAHGREAHAGTARAQGISAIDALAWIVPAIDALTDDERGILATVAMMSGGRRRSVVPGHARAVVDLRAADSGRWDRMLRALTDIVDANDHDATLHLRTAVHRAGVPWTAATDELLATVTDIGNDLGIALRATTSMAAGSSAFAAEAGCVVLDGLGPPGAQLMTDQEHVSVSGIAERAAVLAALVRRLTDGTVPAHDSGHAIGDLGRPVPDMTTNQE